MTALLPQDEESCLDALRALTRKQFILFTPRCNKAILVALQCAKDKSFTRAVIPDEGGWITFKKYPLKLGFELVECKTLHGIVDESALAAALSPVALAQKSVVLLHSMPGYDALQPMDGIVKLCEKRGSFLINDVSGSIGSPSATVGDIIVGSFGQHKPINLWYGGFLATDSKQTYEYCRKHLMEFEPIDYAALQKELARLQEKLAGWAQVRKTLQREVASAFGLDRAKKIILHPDGGGINLIVRYETDEDLQKLINIATRNSIEHTLCPRYIRTNERAVSFEIKRAQDKTNAQRGKLHDDQE